MTLDIIIVLVTVGGVFALFVTELVSVELVAVGAMVALVALGVLTPAEGLAGFGNTATVVVGCMFVLAAALERSGAVEPLTRVFTRALTRRPWLALAGLMLGVAGLSAFVSNTPVVAALIPMVLAGGRAAKINPSKLLIPLSFASIMGGTCTLIGTSTTLVVNDVAAGLGQPRIGVFEMLPMGLVFVGVGLTYMLTIGARLLPDHPVGEPGADDFGFVTELRVVPEGPLDGARLEDVSILAARSDALSVFRRGQRPLQLRSWTRLRGHDIVRVVAGSEEIKRITEIEGLRPVVQHTLGAEPTHQLEVVIPPHSPLAHHTLKSLRFARTFDAIVLGIRQRPQFSPLRLHKLALHPGDVLLIEATEDGVARLREHAAVLVTSAREVRRVRHPWFVVGVIGAAVAAAAVGLLALSTAALAATLVVLARGSLSTETAYRAIEWRVIFLLAAIMSLGVAMQKTGAAQLIASGLVDSLGHLGPVVLISALYLTTSILTEFMSNVGTAAVLTPVAVAIAASEGVDPRPFIMAIVFGGSASFMTPVGYQTNLLVYGSGRYRFRDFLVVGVPLNLLFWALATVFIPVFWPVGGAA